MIEANVTQIAINASETMTEGVIGAHPLREYIMQQAMIFGYIMLAFGLVCGTLIGIGSHRIYLRLKKRG